MQGVVSGGAVGGRDCGGENRGESSVEGPASRGSREDISRMANDFRFAQRGTASRECSKFVKIDQL